ncbi:MAG: lipopolysaccharide kinase InaA family protein, partial [Planctomycetota bacterium]
ATPERAVLRVRAPEGVRVVKVWRRPGPVGRWRSRRAARREASISSALVASGARVPRPLAVVREADGWRLELEAVRGARTLEAWLARSAAWPARAPRLARDLGRLIASLQRAGLAQPDWHPGNLLLDRAGRWTAVDFGRARLARFRRRRAEAELARLAGSLSGRVEWAWIALAVRAWSGELGLGRPAQGDLERLRSMARADRLADVERHLDRWERASGRVEVRDGLLVRRDRARGPLELGQAAEPWTVRAVDRADPRVVRLDAEPRDVRAVWIEAARLAEHRLPGLRPLARPKASPRWALFERVARESETLEAALTQLDERGLEWSEPAPGDPHWWPLHVSRHSPESDSWVAMLASTKRLMRSFF